ncbi:hypothetical protein Agub_g808 [Astrephomene gubernaculifera]|uniref:Uncharacterized protein n=1 Tax=Astrephomene gubernaculifera TaxID=47775 RepID=A0AAD3DFC6_9CHLO|nr:hypothetical protein Agub_g808 [Astrephomene gubernaculifera]
MPGNGRGAPRHTPQSASGAAQTSASAAAMPAAGAPSSRTATPRANCSRPASTAPPSPLRSARISAATADARAAAISTPGTTSTSGAPAAAASGPATPSSTCSRAAAAAAGGGGGAAAAAAPGAPKPAAAAPGTTVAAVRNSYTTTLQASAGLSPRTYITETNIHYKPPPAGFRRAKSATLPPSEMPKPTYPNDWSTSKQADFRPDRLLHPPTSAPAGQPTRPAGQRDSGRLLPDDVPPASQFVTLHRSQFVGGRHAEAAAIPASGGRGTMAAGYNIITGAGPYGNNAFEHWDGRDYRRHR